MPINWDSIWNSAGVFKAFAAGVGGVVLGKTWDAGWGLWKDQLSHRRALDLKQVEHGEARKVREAEYQRTSLLSLQELAMELLEAATTYLRVEHRERVGLFGPAPDYLDIDRDRPYWRASHKFTMYRSRVRDATVLAKSEVLSRTCATIMEESPKNAALDAARDARVHLRELHEAVREALVNLERSTTAATSK
jgi:hypothetical protein